MFAIFTYQKVNGVNFNELSISRPQPKSLRYCWIILNLWNEFLMWLTCQKIIAITFWHFSFTWHDLLFRLFYFHLIKLDPIKQVINPLTLQFELASRLFFQLCLTTTRVYLSLEFIFITFSAFRNKSTLLSMRLKFIFWWWIFLWYKEIEDIYKENNEHFKFS
jgi:hypothetical protein